MVAAVRLFGHSVRRGCVYETYRIPGTALLYAAGWISGCLIAEIRRSGEQFHVRGAYSPLTMVIKNGFYRTTNYIANHLVSLRVMVVAAGAAIMILLSESNLKPAVVPRVMPDITLQLLQHAFKYPCPEPLGHGARAIDCKSAIRHIPAFHTVKVWK